MSDDRFNGQAYLPELVALAKEAGAAIMAVYRSGGAGATSKADDSPLTLADLASHRAIVNGLTRLTPDTAHFYPRLGPTMEWDTAAAHAVVSATGGIVHDREGKELRYNKPDLHNPEFFVHPAMDKELPKVIKGFNE